MIRRLVLWPIAHPRTILIIAAAFALLSAISIHRIRPNGSLAAMFPKDDPAADALVHVLDDFPAADQMLILASLPDSQLAPDPDRLTAFGQRLTDAVQRSDEARSLTDGVFFQPDPQSRQFVEKVIGPAAMFYLDEAAFK